MADVVQHALDSMVADLKDLEMKGIFTEVSSDFKNSYTMLCDFGRYIFLKMSFVQSRKQ
jgi:hypothetical protein